MVSISISSSLNKRVPEHHVDRFENVVLPAFLDAIGINPLTKLVILGNVRITDLDLAAVIDAPEFKLDIREISPFFELPLHSDLLALDELLVDALDAPVEHLEFAVGLWLADRQASSELADLNLICESLVDKARWDTVGDREFERLCGHLLLGCF